MAAAASSIFLLNLGANGVSFLAAGPGALIVAVGFAIGLVIGIGIGTYCLIKASGNKTQKMH